MKTRVHSLSLDNQEIRGTQIASRHGNAARKRKETWHLVSKLQKYR